MIRFLEYKSNTFVNFRKYKNIIKIYNTLFIKFNNIFVSTYFESFYLKKNHSFYSEC